LIRVGLIGFLLTLVFLRVAVVAPIPGFEDVAARSGLTVAHISSPEKEYIIESMSGGAGFIDCDNDGRLDIVIVNGSNVDRYRQGGDPLVTLYHQDAKLHFTNITRAAGLTRKGWGMGVAVADFDNDGWQDLYVTGFGGNALYRNLGNCRFQDVTEKSGLLVGGFSAGAAWGDFDRDGYVDLFVPRYVHLDINNLPEFGSREDSCTVMSVKVQCGPLGLAGESDFLFRNKGQGTFEDVSKKAGVDDPQHGYGMQGLWFDYDNDDWPDLYVANDAGPNYLYRTGTTEHLRM
jgi:enediyne biosynthesis protein E4